MADAAAKPPPVGMKFELDGLEVFFPYPSMYEEQYSYMLELKRSLDAKGHGLLEMPTGTGKTVCVLSLITSYQLAHPEMGKLIYCTRTVPEMGACMAELKRVIKARDELLEYHYGVTAEGRSSELAAIEAGAGSPTRATASTTAAATDSTSGGGGGGGVGEAKDEAMEGSGLGGRNFLALCLSSRRNMCIHERVMNSADREAVDTLCRQMTASWVRQKAENDPGSIETCDFYEEYDKAGSDAAVGSGIYSLDDLKEVGRQKGWCPYFLARHVINHAKILVYNYQYMLDPKVAGMVSRELESESVVVFDEAHNIDNVCIEALSVTLDQRSLEKARESLGKIGSEVGAAPGQRKTCI